MTVLNSALYFEYLYKNSGIFVQAVFKNNAMFAILLMGHYQLCGINEDFFFEFPE